MLTLHDRAEARVQGRGLKETASDECGIRDGRRHRTANSRRLCGLKQTGWCGEQHGDWKGIAEPTGIRYCPITGKREESVVGPRDGTGISAGTRLWEGRGPEQLAELLG